MILGSGWAGFKLVREVDKRKFQVVSVSPRYCRHFFIVRVTQKVKFLFFFSLSEITSFSLLYLPVRQLVRSNFAASPNRCVAIHLTLNITKLGATK